MQQIKIFCDVCEKEGAAGSGGSTYAGAIIRLTPKLEKHAYKFAQDFCAECSEVILGFIEELKKDVKTRGTDTGTEHNK